MLKKSLFQTPPLRGLHQNEEILYAKVNLLLCRKRRKSLVAILPEFVSYDNKSRPLFLHVDIVNKIERDHGKIILENLIINANSWDYVVKNVDGNKDKINLIKKIPNTTYFLLIGANRVNGFFIVTHFESRSENIDKLKNLLQRGDFLTSIEEAALSHLQLPHSASASQLDLPGVNS